MDRRAALRAGGLAVLAPLALVADRAAALRRVELAPMQAPAGPEATGHFDAHTDLVERVNQLQQALEELSAGRYRVVRQAFREQARVEGFPREGGSLWPMLGRR